MPQLYNNPNYPLTGGINSTLTIASGKARGNTKVNVTIQNFQKVTGIVVVEYLSQKGTRQDSISPNVPYFVRDVWADEVVLFCPVTTIIAIDVSQDTDLPANFQGVATVDSSGTAFLPAQSSVVISPGGQNIPVFTVPAGYSLTLQGVIAQLRNTGGSSLTYSTFSIQVYRAASPPLNGVYETILVDSSGETLGGGDDWMYGALAVATSASNLSYSTGGSGTIVGSKFGAISPIVLYPGDFVVLYINLSSYTSGLYADTRVVGVLTPL